MQNWIRNGVEIAWLIQPEKRCVFVYRTGVSEADVIRETSISGEGPVRGFTLDLQPIWEGLSL